MTVCVRVQKKNCLQNPSTSHRHGPDARSQVERPPPIPFFLSHQVLVVNDTKTFRDASLCWGRDSRSHPLTLLTQRTNANRPRGGRQAQDQAMVAAVIARVGIWTPNARTFIQPTLRRWVVFTCVVQTPRRRWTFGHFFLFLCPLSGKWHHGKRGRRG